MDRRLIHENGYTEHPKFKGVFVKHFFNSKDTDRMNNFEIVIVPGFEISTHIHDNTSEFFYVVEGCGEIYLNGAWVPYQRGDAAFAATGEMHGVRNNSPDILKLYAAFSPPVQ